MTSLSTQRLLPGKCGYITGSPGHAHRKHCAGGVNQGEAFSSAGDGRVVRHEDTRGGAVPRHHHVAIKVNSGEIRQLAVGTRVLSHAQLQLLRRVNVPVLTEGLEVNTVHVALAQQVPHGHLESAGVAASDDGDFVVDGQLKRVLQQGGGGGG